MVKDINFNGYTENPSDRDCPDGDLSMSLNLVNEDGALRPVFQPTTIVDNLGTNPTGVTTREKRVCYIHKTEAFTHYIVYHDCTVTDQSTPTIKTKLLWFNMPSSGTTVNPTEFADFTSDHQIYEYNSIGNTLLVLTNKGMFYFLWKVINTVGGYVALGNHFDELPLSFGLQGHEFLDEDFTVNILSNWDGTSGYQVIDTGRIPASTKEFIFKNASTYYPTLVNSSDADIERITNTVLSHVNSFISDHATNAGKFLFPFFVRYAFRLYDGSLTMHSSPVLMVTSSDLSPQAFITNMSQAAGLNNLTKCRIGGIVFDLDYQCMLADSTAITNFATKWKDIIQSVDIFVSAPIYTYKQSGKVEGLMNMPAINMGYTICRMPDYPTINVGSAAIANKTDYSRWWVQHIINAPNNIDSGGNYQFILPQYTNDEVKANIRDCGTFYLLQSIKLSDLTTTRTKITLPANYLQSLLTREVMTDDYDSHDLLCPKTSFTYNQRVNLANVNKTLADPYKPLIYTSYLNKIWEYNSGTGNWSDYQYDVSITVYIERNGKEYIVKHSGTDTMGYINQISIEMLGDSTMFFLYFYYPDANATKVIVHYPDGTPRGANITIPLERNSTLNGSFFFNGWKNSIKQRFDASDTEEPSASADKTVTLHNKLYLSEIANPFFFPVQNIVTVGTGTIIGISTAAKPLSQGQYGQFPLYVFASDGIWALEVAANGTYSTRQNISRDVVLSKDSIAQLDSSVVFATERGLMEIAGSKVTCISDIISAPTLFKLAQTSSSDTSGHPLLSDGLYGDIQGATGGYVPRTMTAFTTFLKNCGMVYDYIHQRLIFFNNDIAIDYYAYVFSLKSRMWGIMQSKLYSALNSYPDTLAVERPSQGVFNLVSFGNITGNTIAWAVTRPLKFGSDNLKTIHDVIVRGYTYKHGEGSSAAYKTKTVLLGSFDLVNWAVVGSSTTGEIRNMRGTPYKYFRLLVLSLEMAQDECFTGASFELEPRRTDVLH